MFVFLCPTLGINWHMVMSLGDYSRYVQMTSKQATSTRGPLASKASTGQVNIAANLPLVVSDQA